MEHFCLSIEALIGLKSVKSNFFAISVRNSGSSIVTCNIVNHPDLVETCTYQFGSHARTFAIYFALYVIYKVGRYFILL